MIKVSWKQSSSEKLRIPDELLSSLSRVRGQADFIQVTIEPVYKQRTMDQNALFHAKVNELAKLSGADRGRIKEEIKGVATMRGYPYDVKNGEIIPKPSSEATIEQMEILIDALYEYAEENGHYIRSE